MTPLADEYLRSLPHGLASHPTALLKASVIREILVNSDQERLAHALPPEIATIVRSPPPVSAWVPEVQATVLFATDIDVTHNGSVDAWLATGRTSNQRIMKSPLYRAMFFLVGPERLLKNGGKRWNQLRQGSTLTSEVGDGCATITLRFPNKLVPRFMARMRAVTFEVVLEVAGAKEGKVSLRSLDDDTAVFEGTWR
ncbi:MAG TPA: hypothetical protein VGO62_13200 [Myxococcota bacterium]